MAEQIYTAKEVTATLKYEEDEPVEEGSDDDCIIDRRHGYG